MRMLRRFFPLLAAISHPIRLRPAGRRETRLSTAGREVCLEIAKTSLFDLSLTSSIAKLYGFAGFGVFPEVFSGGIRPENALWIHSAKLHTFHFGSGLIHAGKQKRFSQQTCL